MPQERPTIVELESRVAESATAHGGIIVSGFPTVMIGIPGQGSILQAAAAAGMPLVEKCPG